MITEAIKKRVDTKIEQCITTIEKKYKVKFKKPAVHYDVRGTTAGKAWYTKWIVGFNPVLLNENVDDFIARTVPHELAHLATELIYPHAHRAGFGKKRSPHGAEWASIMTALGADASRCHTYNVENARVKRKATYSYKCACCGHKFELGPQRHAKIQRGATYWHPSCGKVAGKLVQVVEASITVIKPVKAIAVNIDIKPVKTVSKPVNPTVPAGETKLARCYRLFENYPGYSRAEMINVFVQEAGCTPAGAQTYYSNIKKLIG